MLRIRVWLTVAMLAAAAGCDDPMLPGIGEVGEFNDGDLGMVLNSIRTAESPGVPALGAFTARLVLDNDSVVVDSAVAGLRSATSTQLVATGDLWHIGSLTKSMTASLAARLVEDGTISWETTIIDVFPELAGMIQAVYEDIRLDELMYHTSGLPPDVTQTPSWPTLRSSPLPLMEQRRAWIEELLALEPVATRGTHVYSNAGYVVAGAMLERATGRSWEDLMQDEIFAPLGMTNAGFGPPGTAGLLNEPRGHAFTGNAWTPVEPGPEADNPQAIGPAGTVHASISDLVRYSVEHLHGLRGSSDFFEPATWTKLHTAAPGTGYALGWGVDQRTWANGTVLAHSGSNTIWYAVIWIAPERDMVMVALTNAGGPDGNAGGGRIAERVADQAIRSMILRAGFSL